MLRLMPTATAAALLPLGARPVRRRLGDVDLKVWQIGPAEGEPWILLHGLASTAMSWRAPLARLRRDCRVLVPELSAHGGTVCPGRGLGIGDGAAAVLELARISFGERPVNLGGISLGAWIAVRAALAAPERVGRLVLVAAAGYRDQDWQRISRLVDIDSLEDVERFYRVMFVRTPLLLRAGRRAFRGAYASPSVKRVLTTIAEADAYGDDDLAQLRQPVGLIWGEADGLFELPVARKMAAALPCSHLVVLPGCAHGLQWEQPGLLAAAFRELQSSMTPPPRAAPTEGRWSLRNT
jgi:pimeloyl-ACP methyl ester carboxylesterase